MRGFSFFVNALDTAAFDACVENLFSLFCSVSFLHGAPDFSAFFREGHLKAQAKF